MDDRLLDRMRELNNEQEALLGALAYVPSESPEDKKA